MPTRTSSEGAERDVRDRELFARFVAGEERAFAELYSAYERPLLLYCRHMLATEIEAQDVFQEVWLRLIRIRKREEVVEHFRAMLFTIARNAAINQIRSRQNRRSVSFSAAGIETVTDHTSPRGGGDDMEELVNRALSRLPDAQREAFVLHTILGYSFQEIADMQGVSMTGAKTRAFRARAYLRTLLANWLGLAEDEPEESGGSAPPNSSSRHTGSATE